MTQTVRKDRLSKLDTTSLIAQYDMAVSSYNGRFSNKAPRQTRINFIVDMLTDRADAGDTAALAWFA